MTERPPLPEPDCRGVHFDGHSADQMHSYADTCNAALTAERDELRTENTALRELMNAYNLGGWTDSLRLIKERDELRAQVAALREALRTVAASHAWQLFGECRAFGTDRIPSPGQCHEIARAALEGKPSELT